MYKAETSIPEDIFCPQAVRRNSTIVKCHPYSHWKAEQGWNMAGEMEDLGAAITAQQFSSIKTHSTEILVFNWTDFLSNWGFFHAGDAIAELLINRQRFYRRRLCLSCSLGDEKSSVL